MSLRAKLTRYGDDKDSSSNGEELRMGLEAGVCVLKCCEDRPCVCVCDGERERKIKKIAGSALILECKLILPRYYTWRWRGEGNTSVC